MCIFTVKSIVKYYTRQSSPVYTCFLDASKLLTLFRKLIGCQVPLLIVRILIFWYQMQLVCIKWGTAVSQYFRISNGVRQGGILSPKLFALYMNVLSGVLSHCYMCGVITYHLLLVVMYAVLY